CSQSLHLPFSACEMLTTFVSVTPVLERMRMGMLWTVSVRCKPSWKNRRRAWMGGWRPSSRPQATLPSYLDDDGRHVVCLGAPGPLADLVHEGGNDFAWWFVAVCTDHLERAANSEGRASP